MREFGAQPEIKDRIISPKLKKAFRVAGTLALALTLLGDWKGATLGLFAADGIEKSYNKKDKNG